MRDVICCAQCKWTSHRRERLLIFCHRTSSMKPWKYLVSQSKFYLPQEYQIKVFLSNFLNITSSKLLSIVHPVLYLHRDTHFFSVDFPHNNSFFHNTKKVAFPMQFTLDSSLRHYTFSILIKCDGYFLQRCFFCPFSTAESDVLSRSVSLFRFDFRYMFSTEPMDERSK